MKIKRIPAKSISYGGTRRLSDIFYIVIHYTSNKGDTAENNGLYFKNVNKVKAGAHFFIDQKGNVVQSINLNRIAWTVVAMTIGKRRAAATFTGFVQTEIA